MKKILFTLITLFTFVGVHAQNVADTLATDTIKKKKILIEDSWSKKKEKAKSQRTTHKYRNSRKIYKRKRNYNSDTTKVDFMNKNIVKVVDDNNGTKIKVGKIGKFAVQEKKDTTKIRIGGKVINIIDGWHGTRIRIKKVHPWDPDDEFFIEGEDEFRGHWAGFGLGINGFSNEDYGMYPADQDDFMKLHLVKSTAVWLNFLQYDISLQKERNTIGLVTGLGVEWNNYRFDNKITINKEGGKVVRVPLNKEWDVKKSKLTVFYLNVPLLVEFQIPVKYEKRRIHISTGVVAGLRLGSHTKVKYKEDGDTEKDKNHDNFYLNTLRCGAHLRIGYRGLNLFATYGLTDLFEKNKAPEITPYSVGITLVSF